MRRAAFWLIPLITFAVALFIVLFLVRINPSVPKMSSSEKENAVGSSEGLREKLGSWISHFSTTKESGYFYPVNEVTLKLDVSGENSALDMYRVTVAPKSTDELLQVKEELKKSELPYEMQNNEEPMLLTVDSTDQLQLQSLVTKLKTYQITAKLSPYTEEK
ncbi:hypothetical protein [Sulfuricurvum sp.]|uniref:hypothetical protein n=1 Tax=Sulfuricurvum sp. TaxID=2025608 RepID=UPI0025F90F0C|nr:hypothetical protein [Sulfuricurvum sp.]